MHGRASAAQSVQLAWDPSPDPDVIGYVVHYGLSSGQYPKALDVGNRTTALIPGLAEGIIHYLMVTAYTANRVESIPSNEVTYQVPPLPAARLELIPAPGTQAPATLRATLEPGRQYLIQASSDLKTWTTIHTGIVGSEGEVLFQDPEAATHDRRFYRLSTVPRDIPGILAIRTTAGDSGSLATRTMAGNPGGITVSYSVQSGLGYTLQASADLLHWTSLVSGTNSSDGWQDYHDLAALRAPMQFYRLKHP